jgi:hypothetical protein
MINRLGFRLPRSIPPTYVKSIWAAKASRTMPAIRKPAVSPAPGGANVPGECNCNLSGHSRRWATNNEGQTALPRNALKRTCRARRSSRQAWRNKTPIESPVIGSARLHELDGRDWPPSIVTSDRNSRAAPKKWEALPDALLTSGVAQKQNFAPADCSRLQIASPHSPLSVDAHPHVCSQTAVMGPHDASLLHGTVPPLWFEQRSRSSTLMLSERAFHHINIMNKST